MRLLLAVISWVHLLLWHKAGAFKSSSSPGPDSDTLHNANHLFRTLISAGRQFPSSINHNGVSFFLATVPAGTRLYHGRGSAEPVGHGMEWLAFEPEHAMNFANTVCFVDDDGQRHGVAENPRIDASVLSSGGSPKWWLDLATLWDTTFQATDIRTNCTCPPEAKTSDLSKKTSSDRPHAQQQQRPLHHQSPSSDHNNPHHPPRTDICLQPGHLHTYAAPSQLHLLYIDGMSAAKSPLGTLASQDLILLHNSPYQPHPSIDPMSAEIQRATGLCDLAKSKWDGKIDGFVRMEHGFEILLCDFTKVSFEGAVMKNRTMMGWTGRREAAEAAALQFWRAVGEDRYWGIGSGRLRVWTERWVSAFTVPGLDLWKGSIDGVLPSLEGMKDEAAEGLVRQVEELARQYHRQGDQREEIDWQGIAVLYVQRYAKRLQYLMEIDDVDELVQAVKEVYMVYLDDEQQHSSDDDSESKAIQRCTHAFIPSHLTALPIPDQSISQQAVSSVANRICTTLHNIQSKANAPLADHQNRLHDLEDYLRWPQWAHCNGDRACGLDEVCFTAIWPWGSQEDHDEPRCRNKTELLEVMGRRPGEDDYWRTGRGRRR